MRFVVYGAGAIGGFVAARLHRGGAVVTAVARGEHLARIREAGLLVKTPDGEDVVRVPTVDVAQLGDVDASDDVMALLCVKSQDTLDALLKLRAALPDLTRIACVQNGVENERVAARFFPTVYGVSVMCPNVYLGPGVISAFSSPVIGVMDAGRFVGGTEDELNEFTSALRDGGFASDAVPDIMAVKYGKLLPNLGNAVEAVCGPAARRGPIMEIAQQEARNCLSAANIRIDERPDRSSLITPREIDGRPRPGGSTWQSIQRRLDTAETDYLNGEICLLGRQFGQPTPVNDFLQRLVREVCSEPDRVATFTEADVLARSGPR